MQETDSNAELQCKMPQKLNNFFWSGKDFNDLLGLTEIYIRVFRSKNRTWNSKFRRKNYQGHKKVSSSRCADRCIEDSEIFDISIRFKEKEVLRFSTKSVPKNPYGIFSTL